MPSANMEAILFGLCVCVCVWGGGGGGFFQEKGLWNNVCKMAAKWLKPQFHNKKGEKRGGGVQCK